MEYSKVDPYHHAGEFIELFNYTTEDIDIGSWIIADDENSFIFPRNTVVKSNDFLIIAYINDAIKSKNANYFLDFFPTTRPHSDKIIYTDKIILNNYKESVSLFMTTIRGEKLNTNFSGVRIDGISWEFSEKKLPKGKYSTHNLITDFDYYSSSYHKNAPKDYINIVEMSRVNTFNSNFDKANPFELYYKPSLINLEDITYVKEAIYQFEHFGKMKIIPELFNLTCNIHIPTIGYTIPSDNYTNSRCFQYDSAGNYINSMRFCLEQASDPIGDDEIVIGVEKSIEELFFVTPNPTNGKITISWDKSLKHSLSQIYIIPFNGSNSIQIKFNSLDFETSYDLITFSKGIYFVEFILEDGRKISKKIIKL